MKITPGKRKGLEAVSDSRGVIAAAAMDQRGSLKSAIAKEKGIDKKDVTAADARGVQDRRLEARSRRTPAPSCSIPNTACPPRKPALEECRPPARLRRQRLRQHAARPPARPARRSGPCAAWSPPAPTASRSCSTTRRSIRPRSTTSSTPGSSASALNAPLPTFRSSSNSSATKKAATKRASTSRAKSPKSSPQSMAEFSKPQYGVDILKVEVPVEHGLRRRHAKPARATPPTRATKPRTISASAAAAAKKPFIYLSAGVEQ